MNLPEDWQKGSEEDMNVIHDCYCINCHESVGTTFMLPTNIPSFREIYIMSFQCPNCHFSNAEVNFGGEIQPKGQRISLSLVQKKDLDRQLVKSDSCCVLLPDLDLEIPPQTQRGTITTIEGILRKTLDHLQLLQPERLRLGDVDNFHRCQTVIDRLKVFLGDNNDDDDEEENTTKRQNGNDDKPSFIPFTIVLDDIAGNSFIENPFAPQPDPNMKFENYIRTPNQDMRLGLQPSAQAKAEGAIQDDNPQHSNPVNSQQNHQFDNHLLKSKDKQEEETTTTESSKPSQEQPLSFAKQEVMKFPTMCPHCGQPAETDMCMTDIPHFKEVILMSLVCDHCGYKSNEIKGGGAIPKYGQEITLYCTKPQDLAREVLKSDTAGISIPELELELQEGGLDGVYTTIEGLLQKMQSRLTMANPFSTGDAAVQQHGNNNNNENDDVNKGMETSPSFSQPSEQNERYRNFLKRLDDMSKGQELPFHVVITDPLANSFVGPIPQDALALALQAEREGNNDCYQSYVDSGMVLKEFIRTHDQNEMLGLNDIKTENYQHDEQKGEEKPYYGTDAPLELPDRLRRLDIRGPDHPHAVAKAPVEGDVTVMGDKSIQFAVPALAQRGQLVQNDNNAEATTTNKEEIQSRLKTWEQNDKDFCAANEYSGAKDGMVYKQGAQGLGYYTDYKSLEQLDER